MALPANCERVQLGSIRAGDLFVSSNGITYIARTDARRSPYDGRGVVVQVTQFPDEAARAQMQRSLAAVGSTYSPDGEYSGSSRQLVGLLPKPKG